MTQSNTFVIDSASVESFSGRTLLLDTNVLIDAYRLPAEFYNLTQELAAIGCDFITTKSIALEFLGGTKDTVHMQKKQEFLETLFGRQLKQTYLPLDRGEPDTDSLLMFSRHAQNFSIADFELYCTLKKYSRRIALVTRNHRDFPSTLVDRVSFITLLGNAEVHTYGIYEYPHP